MEYGKEYCEEGQVPDPDPLLGGWPCCLYEKAWMFKAESSSQLVLNGLVFDSRSLAPGTGGKKTDEMPGTTGYEI